MSVTVTYTIGPPSAVSLATPTSGLASFPVAALATPQTTPPTYADYYTGLLKSLSEGQASLNASLTAWKEAIGDGEKLKEVKAQPGKGKAAMMAKGAKEDELHADADAAVDSEEESEQDE